MRIVARLSPTCVGICVGLCAACDGEVVGWQPIHPILVADRVAVDFGFVRAGSSAEAAIEIENRGNGALALAGAFTTPRSDPAFSIAIPRDTVLPPAGAARLVIRFAPDRPGARAATFEVRAKDEGVAPILISAAGHGALPSVEVAPADLRFGDVILPASRTIPIGVQNAGPISAEIAYVPGRNVQLCGDQGTAAFCIAATTIAFDAGGRFTLAPGESTALNVTFDPAVAGIVELGSFQLGGRAISLEGTGLGGAFRCSPAELDLGNSNPGACANGAVTCENAGSEPLTVVRWAADPSTSADFAVETFSTPARLAPGDEIAIGVSYCPRGLGEDTGLLEIDTDDRDVSHRRVAIPLAGSGGGPDVEVSSDVLAFGQVALNAPARRTIHVRNAGFAPLAIAEIASMADNGPFRIVSGEAPLLIPVGGVHVLTIELLPVAAGPVESRLFLRSNDMDEPEVVIALRGEGVDFPPCAFEVAPRSLGFGVAQRHRTTSRAIEIRNVGTAECLVTSARLVDGSDPAFSLPDGDVRSLSIAGGSSKALRVAYTPGRTGASGGTLELSLSNPTTPFNHISLSGMGADAALLVTPNDLDFGAVGAGCAARTRMITIYNSGSTPARIDSIAIGAPGSRAFVLGGLPAPLPAASLTLAPGASTSFQVDFRAHAVGSFAAAVEIAGVFNRTPVTSIVSLTGAGSSTAMYADAFEQHARPKVDILFVVDDSCSMAEEQRSLASNFQRFIQFAGGQTIDYQIGVTTTDAGDGHPAEAGRLVPLDGPAGDRAVTPGSLPSPEVLFARNVNVGIDQNTYSEQGLEAAYLALSHPLIAGHNAGFLRSDAFLSVIVVSDEADYSPEAVHFYTGFFQSIKGFRNPHLFSFSAITGDAPNGCSGPGGQAHNGQRYIEAAQATGGQFLSICTNDWGRALEDLARIAFGHKSRFHLTNQPLIGTIRVYVDGVEVTAQSTAGAARWTYEYPTNSIHFTPLATPEPGAQVRVEYVVECL